MSGGNSSLRTIDPIEFRRRAARSGIAALWLRVIGNREEYAARLRQHIATDRSVVLVLRRALFDNPNSVVDDFVSLMEENRMAFSEINPASASEHGMNIVILARTDFDVPQLSSPALLPRWFPILPGESVELLIEDLTWLASAPLNASETHLGDICELLFELEGLIISRIDHVRELDHTATCPFLQAVRSDGEIMSLPDLLTKAQSLHSTVTNPRAFRPSLKSQGTLLTRIWAAVAKQAPEKLGVIARATALALALEDGYVNDRHECLLAVLGRPTSPDVDRSTRWARSLFLTVNASCHLTTAAAHSDAYPCYPLLLLRSVSQDLRRALNDACQLLRWLRSV